MGPDKSGSAQPQEKHRVTLQTPQALEYWTYRLHCTEAELRDAVASVGEEPELVREYLHRVRGERDEE
jgi:hypothetical protein